MPDYRRSKISGGSFFFTVVTFNRLPILTGDTARNLLHDAWIRTQARFPFQTLAVCQLPNHLHCIWALPEEDSNFSVRWKEIKRLFTKGYLEKVGPGEPRNASRQKRQEAAIWQRRFWEHTLRDEADLNRHIDYIHFNPVKHGLVKRVADWPWSSFHRYVKMGYYDIEWGQGVDERIRSGKFKE
jgi:putative transposase